MTSFEEIASNMRVVRGLAHLQPLLKGCVLTIGNFDGLHLGHRALIEKLAEKGRQMNLPVVVIIFEPQPQEYFMGDNAPSRLMRLREKVTQFSTLPVDILLVMKFDMHFANSDAEDFIREVLVAKLNVKHLVVGDDFHFGKARKGNFALLNHKSQEYGFKVEDSQSYRLSGHRISSTLIRDALGEGDLPMAEKMLGRSYSICGRVAYGERVGRTIGFPTANIRLLRRNTPIDGVFAVRVSGLDDTALPGVANVGTRPTVNGASKVTLETHLFDFNRDIYGRQIEVHFIKKIRDERRFESLQELKTQIEKDVTEAKEFLLK
ncbi:bifunctional riboflavin kinase/FAD synthetase [Methylicorpusculum oleiharenae]|uniref:bifunctional riboflavin kinase/FAD synthetase n=1 Tax=Methylicorpusculum oleiharenae TaxID=1338687 RepID=UPI001E4FEB6E|nr:bifunctional riboflavin kinase/FAD synthetase [Methylicorpusculum oleiharenae]MCD2450321.1 bifunctional riboflavin kinase/FAD synthetase [Methylicorpusculum oleiharenae]